MASRPDLGTMDTEKLKEVLAKVDEWIHKRRPRWMDLIGDYAGDEFFIVDGDSLCQVVLEDELVAIGGDKPTFQILHAIYRLEQEIQQLKQRNCNFEIVFFESNKHGTILTGANKFTTASRYLAREILKAHISQLSKVGIHSANFKDLKDPEWHNYVSTKQPMFVILHAGPPLDDIVDSIDKVALSRTLLPRTFLRNLLASRIAVSTLNQIKYVDAKILSFVYERQRLADITSGQPQAWMNISSQAAHICDTALEKVVPPTKSSSSKSYISWLIDSIKAMLAESKNPLDAQFAFLFFASQMALGSMSMQQRAVELCVIDQELSDYLKAEFYPAIFRHLGTRLLKAEFFPDLDGNLFMVLLNCVLKSPNVALGALVGEGLAQDVSSAWTSAGLSIPNLGELLSQYAFTEPKPVKTAPAPRYELLPFSHPIFDEYLPSITTTSESQSSEDLVMRTRVEALCDEPFMDEKHWHNDKSILPKHLGGTDDQAPLTDWEKMKKLRREQRFMANLQRHAQTMVGAKGQPIKRIVISEATTSLGASGSRHEQRPKDPAPRPLEHKADKPGKGAKAKAPQLNSAQKLKAKIEAEKQVKKATEDETWWKSQLKEISAMEDLEEQFRRVDLILQGKRAESGWLSVEVLLYRINLVIESWNAHERKEDESVCEDYTVRILQAIDQFRENRNLFPAAANILSQIMEVLGFGSFTPPKPASQDDRELSFKFVKLVKSKSGRLLHPHLRIKSSPIEFQLKAYGTFMDRSMDSAPDPRVGFEPDGWQRKVLDRIDRSESTLVVAPTSAGKTFSSFYAMEKVLRESNDGIIVYVSPTKALCQQIAADVYARFSKNMKGKTIWAIHTRDFRVNDPLRTQILVTVPDILSIMLLSPSLSRIWVPRIKFIILDEIHSIGQLEGGQVWEHILLLSTCPILGLSATVGQPEAFSEWLGSVQKEHNQGYAMIEHKYRYSHLRKYIWEMPKPGSLPSFNGLKSPALEDSRLRVLHPMSALLLGGGTMPPDLALESQDCLSLYSMMTKCVSRGELQHLDPHVFFKAKDTSFLAQIDVIRYEEALKEIIEEWMNAKDARAPDSSYQKLLRELEDNMSRSGSIGDLEDAHPHSTAVNGFIHLLHKLNSNGDLPCLAFCFDRSGCEDFAKGLTISLIRAERTWRASNRQWLQKMEQWEAWKATFKLRQREADRASRQKKDDPQTEESTSWHSTFDPNDPSPEFSFANPKSGYSKEDLQKDVAVQKWQRDPWPAYLISALRRGIAVHHAGMPKGYRVLVESLFRLGYCRVVISTGTLALGINAPAKSVVFLGDSPYLTALMYRQLGKVIFYNLPLDRIYRLMLSRLPPLTGNWPLTTTLCLRLFNLLTGSDEAPAAVTAIDSFMRLPRLSLSSDQTRNEVLHHMRFSIEYLRRLRLLSNDGHVTALFGAVGHLYYEEPGNLVFASLVRSGVIHRMCSQYKFNKVETERNIIHLVATLVARLPLPYFSSSQEVLKRLRSTLPSLIQLPPLPSYIQNAFQQYNEETLRIFSTYAVTYAHQHLKSQPDSALPLSLHEVGSSEKLSGGIVGNALKDLSLKGRIARSAFVSNSGHGDTFESVAELCRSTRSGLHLSSHNVPYFEYDAPVNAYALDYWQHESVHPLIEANGLRAGEVWFVLQNFSLALTTILTSLRALLIDRTTRKNSEPEPETKPVGQPRSKSNNWDDSEASEDEQDHKKTQKTSVEKEEINDEGDDQEGALAEGELLGQLEITDRPDGVEEEDWLVYSAFQSVSTQFYEKWRKMWA
ncbi:P-loop containing nucleoside triphosphate hydrolase protein [Rhizoctonia solani]|uniref:P-loop containing nucleoside triphosphate hydrolase protein n=1 Tax=Rhizoctonia solani TaxID=456999 RepID=A0A8H7H4D8_9AGAM|nr:P-loop containing nucleoside triphosphate hydrolase protein [Rhizoctonia solani]